MFLFSACIMYMTMKGYYEGPGGLFIYTDSSLCVPGGWLTERPGGGLDGLRAQGSSDTGEWPV